MTWELIGVLFLGFLSMIGIYTLLRQLERWILGREETGAAAVLLFPVEDPEENKRRCRRALLQLEAHPLAPNQELMVLEEKDGALETFGLMGEKTAVSYLTYAEAIARLEQQKKGDRALPSGLLGENRC